MPVKKESRIKNQESRGKTKKSVVKPVVEEKVVSRKSAGLSVPVYSLLGRATGTLSLPKEIFGKEANQKLLSQALRVYMTNQKNFTASTKTRGQVRGSTRKIYRQKGTGGARHGAISAPIFVGGGVVFGPHPRKVRLDLPKKMKKAALIAALSEKCKEQGIVGVSGLEKASGKTKEMAKLVGNLKLKSALIVTDKKLDNIVRAVRNISGLDVLPAEQINAYEILKHQSLVISKEAVAKLTGKGKS